MVNRTVLVGALLLAFVGSAGGVETESQIRQLRSDAHRCSLDALQRYTESSTETAETIAEVAFDRCMELWRRYADAAGSQLEADPGTQRAQQNCIRNFGENDPHCVKRPASTYSMAAAHDSFVHDARIAVFELRSQKR
jgi:hypothetical protein